jgi:hypothetical protein
MGGDEQTALFGKVTAVQQELVLVNEWLLMNVLPCLVRLLQCSLLMAEFITTDEYKFYVLLTVHLDICT